MEQVYTITYATIWNPGGGNFQESRISERGLVRAFFADACVSFQLVNNTRESASIAFTFAARPRSAVEKYRWIRYPVGQVPVAQLPRARALILSSLFAIASFQVYRVYQEGASCSNWRWSPIETAFTQSTSAATTTNFARYSFFLFSLSLSLRFANVTSDAHVREGRLEGGGFGLIFFCFGDIVYIGDICIKM